MILTNHQMNGVWDTLYCVGTELEVGEVTPQALDWLIMRGYVATGEPPQLTDKGRRTFKVMETGEGTIPELDGPGFEV